MTQWLNNNTTTVNQHGHFDEHKYLQLDALVVLPDSHLLQPLMNLEANLGLFYINAECCGIVWKWQVLTKRVEWSWEGSSFLWPENTEKAYSRGWYWNGSRRWGRDCWWKAGVWPGGSHGLSASSLPSCTLGPDVGGFWQLVLVEQESVVRVRTPPRSSLAPSGQGLWLILLGPVLLSVLC